MLFVHESGMLQSVFDKLFTLLEQPDPSINLAAMPGATVVTASPEVRDARSVAGASRPACGDYSVCCCFLFGLPRRRPLFLRL